MKLGFFAAFWCVIAINAFKGNSFSKGTDLGRIPFYMCQHSANDKELLLKPVNHQNQLLQNTFILA